MAFDSRRGRMVLVLGPHDLLETWEFDGQRWTQVQTTGPNAADNNIAFDPVHGNMVLFTEGKTWLYDGVTWTSPAAQQPPRVRDAKAVFDQELATIVLAGGFYISDQQKPPSRETWLWDGQNWTRSDDLPVGVTPDQLVFDEIRRAVVMRTSTGLLTFDGHWHEVTIEGAGSIRSGFLFFDAATKSLSLISGSNRGSTQLFRVNNNMWTQQPAVKCSFSGGGVVAYDPMRRGVMLYGSGQHPLSQLAAEQVDLLLASGDCLTLHNRARAFPVDARAVADPLRHRVLAVGGHVGPRSMRNNGVSVAIGDSFLEDNSPGYAATPAIATLNDGSIVATSIFTGDSIGATYRFVGDSWRLINTNAPSSASLVAEPGGGVLATPLLGESGYAVFRNGQWSSVLTPFLISNSSAAYDPKRRRTVMFGGQTQIISGQIVSNETWEWDGTHWTKIDVPRSPSARANSQLAYDPRRQRVVMHGGMGQQDFDLTDSWEYDGARWTPILTENVAQPLRSPSFAYSMAGSMLLLGGEQNATQSGQPEPPVPYYELSWRAAENPPDRCIAIQDTDGDDLTGCADPDCWDRCHPLCPPGVDCDPSSPHCGDTHCDEFEDWSICPGDCPLPAP
jgi:hypothetical protein